METKNKIKRLRKQRNLSQKQLAELLSVNVSVMNRIELGTRPLLHYEINKLCDIFNVSSDYLLRDDYDLWYTRLQLKERELESKLKMVRIILGKTQ